VSALVARAPAKVNLCLLLGPTRPDGRHDLLSVVQSLSLADELRLEPAGGKATVDEVVCPGVTGENLAARALAEFRAATGWDAPPQRLTIDKRVPVAAGLGGGSGDAAAALRLAAAASGLGDGALLMALAARLGSDVPAQLRPARALVHGAGERVRVLGPGEPMGVLVLASERGLATPDVFRAADRLGLTREGGELERARGTIAEALELDPSGAIPYLGINDLAAAAIDLDPEIEQRLERARSLGAEPALVSGSGPTVVGLFRGPGGHEAAKRAAEALGDPVAAPGGPAAVVAEPVDVAFGHPRML
jgi:4-diphosphocytidyl-2-C-methyl-D-erythritol kinase